ncbi:MAG: DUF2721 domain-containing protein [Cyclobacteriaceae bacterium]|nr:DUF2721 domain-containing protein [Cyclobacteriaceae bacterium]
MEMSINTPAILFPAISLMMLAYTNRFLALASLIRKLYANYAASGKDPQLKDQINNLRRRLNLVRLMQASGVLSFFLCVVCMLLSYLGYGGWAVSIFGLSLVCLLYSLALSLKEIFISTRALEIALKDMEA